MSKILVTGGAGFVGSFLVDKLVKEGHQVTIYDNLDEQVHIAGQEPYYLNKEAEFIKADVRDYDSLKKAIEGKEFIYHLAAAVGIGQSQYAVKYYVDVNIGGTANLLDIIVNCKNSVKKMMVASSMSIYGEGAYKCKECGLTRIESRKDKDIAVKFWEPICPQCNNVLKHIHTNESLTLLPTSIYAITKKTQEEMVLNIGRTYHIPVVALRFFNIFGPRQSLSNPYTGVMAIFISRYKNNKHPVIYEDGKQSRDFISVHDIVDACKLSMEKDEANYQAFNVGTGLSMTVKDIAYELKKFFKNNIEPDILNKFRKGDIRHCYADISRIKNVLGFSPRISFKKGLEELVEESMKIAAQDKFNSAEEELRSKGLVQ